uniref:Uncharacterized protein n=1 Tax=Arundo donax TaxID=35708 RepID=A0A0A9DFI7_ARUDO
MYTLCIFGIMFKPTTKEKKTGSWASLANIGPLP